MIFTEKKAIEEILEFSKNDKNIFLLSCNGCPEAAETGGLKALNELKEELIKNGKTIVGEALIDTICNKLLVGMRLMRHKRALEKSDAVIVLSCGIGVQATSSLLEKSVYPALNTTSMGGFQGLWPSDERCAQCGNCMLAATGGICPIAFCSKSLLNGACGGTKDGMCEVDKDKDCGWHLIYERLKKTGKLDNLKKFKKARNFKKMEPTQELRKKVFFDIEQ